MNRKTWNKIALVALAIAVWVTVIVASGVGWNPFNASWDFTNTGAFGDSFGPLSAVMAGIAAVSAIAAFNAQQREIDRLKERELDSDRAQRKSEFEKTFFQLMQTFQHIVSDTDIHNTSSVKKGRDAFKSILIKFSNEHFRTSNQQQAWTNTIDFYKNDLNHYFRFMYHIVNYIDQSEIDNKYFYVRILRASLSDSELTLLCFNCAYGEGKEKFLPLVYRYALFHNLSEESKREWKIENLFDREAFHKS